MAYSDSDALSAKILLTFDINAKQPFNYEKFQTLCVRMFSEDEVEQNELRVREIFELFDANADGVLSNKELYRCCMWIHTIMNPINVLLVVDVQNDFIDGTLALRKLNDFGQEGLEVVEPINRLLREGHWDEVIYTQDWHPENHISFFDNLAMRELHPTSEVFKHACLHMKRTGWVKRNISDPETIAGHMYRMAMLSFLVDGKEKLDKIKIMQMTLIHDLAECIVGDITPYCGIPPDEKHRMEDEAMEDICKLLGDKGPEILQIFREYEKQESPEAQYVKDLDRLDLLMQAYEYEKRDNIPGELNEFFVAINGKIRHPVINKIAIDITEERDKFCRNINVSK